MRIIESARRHLGTDLSTRLLEVIIVEKRNGEEVIIHAQKLTRKYIRYLHIEGTLWKRLKQNQERRCELRRPASGARCETRIGLSKKGCPVERRARTAMTQKPTASWKGPQGNGLDA